MLFLFRLPCISCGTVFNSAVILLIHAAEGHFSLQLKRDFSISPSCGSTCSHCQHDFTSYSELVRHLGLAHHGLLKYFTNYKACGSKILQKAMEAYRLCEHTIYECKQCPGLEFKDHYQAMKHVFRHLSEETRRQIEHSLRQWPGRERYTCTRCHQDFGSQLEGLIHLVRNHNFPSDIQACSQLIARKDKPICLDTQGGTFEKNRQRKEGKRDGVFKSKIWSFT
jgi:hypothetical protein